MLKIEYFILNFARKNTLFYLLFYIILMFLFFFKDISVLTAFRWNKLLEIDHSYNLLKACINEICKIRSATFIDQTKRCKMWELNNCFFISLRSKYLGFYCIQMYTQTLLHLPFNRKSLNCNSVISHFSTNLKGWNTLA